MRAAGTDPDNTSDETKFRRDIKALRAAGWHIDAWRVGHNDYRYRLRVVDNRIRATFSDSQRAQLLRAAQRAGLGQLYEDLNPDLPDGTASYTGPEGLGTAEHAVRMRCLLTFTYRAKQRRVHPYDVYFSGDDWYLRGREEGTDQDYKTFRLSRAEEMQAESPGSAEPVVELPAPNRDPMRVPVVDPFPVRISTTEQDLPDVVNALGVNGHQVLGPDDDGDRVVVEVSVTNPDALLNRVFELDSRVQLLGPDSVRSRARQILTEAAGRAR
jgi:predicted DNA-binding transcriptional regulator YafY